MFRPIQAREQLISGPFSEQVSSHKSDFWSSFRIQIGTVTGNSIQLLNRHTYIQNLPSGENCEVKFVVRRSPFWALWEYTG